MLSSSSLLDCITNGYLVFLLFQTNPFTDTSYFGEHEVQSYRQKKAK